MKNRYTLLLAAGAAAWGLCGLATAQTPYSEDFELATLVELMEDGWSFTDVSSGAPVLLTGSPEATRFLGEFGGDDGNATGAGDVVYLNLDLPQNTVTVRLQFDAYLLRTWDGIGTALYSGPDTFGYGISGQDARLRASFSNGAGKQDYCPFSPTPTCDPTWGSDPLLKNELGFNVELEPAEGSTVPAKGTPMSLVYHFDSGPIPYSGDSIAFKFFSENLQVRDDLVNKVIDESWGLDNVSVTAQLVPEPQTFALLLAGLLLLSFTANRRARFPR